jgi:hypothetical protein
MAAKHLLFGTLLALWQCSLAMAQLSPGPLSQPHQQLEGVTRCASCHDFGAGSRSFKCLDCHAEIRRRVDAHAGYHGRAYKASREQADCARCHMEHNGQRFPLVRLDRNTFNHEAQTGFALQGKHRQQKCEACHNEKRISAAARVEIKEKDLNKTYLGLSRNCTFCHEDQHRGQLGAECNRCHNQEGWRPAPGFTHSRAAFQLTGLHQSVACQKCHVPREGEKATLFKGISFAGCQSCHMDPHHGAFQDAKFQGSCDSCHNTSGWKNEHVSPGFAHANTRFPLVGKHAALACEKCHKTSNFEQAIPHERCQDCHQDPHHGQFATRAAGSDCSSCHNETGFKPTKFDLETHRQSRFPLEGKHASLRCDQCHEPKGKDTVYITGKLTCPACHTDRHAGEFAGPPWANRCDQCHTTDGFQPTTFSVSRHAQTQFALAGKHESAQCHDCHKPLAIAASTLPPASAPPLQYHFPSRACNTCHMDPHQTKLSCDTCHTPQGWKDVLAFDHSTTKFKIEGAHRDVKCIQCHVAADKAPPVFSGTRNQCHDCHNTKDPHAGQFLTTDRQEDCSACHTPIQWKQENFDHDRTRFPLNVAHRNVPCAKCHMDEVGKDNHVFRRYRDTPIDCVKCH